MMIWTTNMKTMNMKTIFNMVYRHVRTDKPYLKLFESKIKIGGVWSPCVIYLCLYINKDGMIWVRESEDFKQNFIK